MFILIRSQNALDGLPTLKKKKRLYSLVTTNELKIQFLTNVE